MTADKMTITQEKFKAMVCINSWAGRAEYPCRVVGETPKRYLIEVDKPTALPGFRLLLPGQTKLVPKRAIRFEERRDKL